MTSGAPLPGTRLRPVGDSMTRPGEEQGPGRCDAHQCRWPGRCEPRARRLRLLLLSGRPDTNEGCARTLANAAPGPCPQCGAGGPRLGPDCKGRWALGPHGSRKHLARVLAARGWEPFSFNEKGAQLTSPAASPNRRPAPSAHTRHGPERPVSRSAQFCQRKGAGLGGGRGEGAGARAGTQQAPPQGGEDRRTDGDVGRTECHD